MSINDVYLSALGEGADEYTGPPARELRVSVIGGNAFLGVVPSDGFGNRQEQNGKDVIVPARSLLRALQAGIDDAEDTLPGGINGR